MKSKTPLKRTLKLSAVTFYGVGAILGAGIYVLIGEVVAVAGANAPFSFLMASIIALFSAFSYAELGARFPRSAGEAVYVDEAFGVRWLTQLIGLLVVATGIVSAATMATGVVGYFQIFLSLPSIVVIILFVVAIAAIAIWGIEESAWVVMLITFLEVCGLLYIVVIAGDTVQSGASVSIPPIELKDSSVLMGIMLGSFLAFYAYIGFEDMVNIAEEIQQPEKVLPKAILLALIIATLLYMVVTFAALTVLPAEQLAGSPAPLAAVVSAVGHDARWISLISLIAVVNGAIVQLIMASRVIYGMASKQLLPTGLALVNARTATPVRATVLCSVITLLLALLFPLGALAQGTSVVVLSVFALVNLALIRLNTQAPEPVGETGGTVHYPSWVPWVGLILCAAMLIIKAMSLFFGFGE